MTIAYAALPSLVVQAVHEDETGVANAINSICRSLGQALGSTLAVTLIAARIDAAEAEHWLARVGLAGLGERFPRQLSLGQQRRLGLARAFAARPDILMMDEPFASLDADTAGRMIALTDVMLHETGAGLVLVTHDPREAAALRAEPVFLGGRPARIV